MAADVDWRKRITSDPALHHGDPCIVGTRVPVSVIVGSVAEGDTFDEILRGYPQLTREDIQAALQCAAEAVNRFDLLP
ncbi:MAG: DUF433 domain-containing protein, partial [Chloroflexi bacterium]|nr:DUF433 domain-containing protein [Chloroflexota bacterium]